MPDSSAAVRAASSALLRCARRRCRGACDVQGSRDRRNPENPHRVWRSHGVGKRPAKTLPVPRTAAPLLEDVMTRVVVCPRLLALALALAGAAGCPGFDPQA